VRYQRLILEAGTNAVTVRFHPRLTVIAGVGRAERELLVTEVLGAMAGGRGGAHLEVVEDNGRRLGIVRPSDGKPDRVIEIETGADVTSEFTTDEGNPDLLAGLGLSAAAARRCSRLTAAEMMAESQRETLLSALAAIDQPTLWTSAQRLVDAERALATETRAAGAAPEDLPLIEEVERRHAAYEQWARRSEQLRRHSIVIGAACAVGAVPAVWLNLMFGLPFLAVAVVTVLLALMFRRKMVRAEARQAESLARAGAQSYLGFQLQRVDRLFVDGGFDRVSLASEEHRGALRHWHALVGDVTTAWALEHRAAIEERATRLITNPRPAPSLADGLPDLDPAELAHWLAARFTELRRVGPTQESLPLILDDPLVGIDAGVKQWVLELIGRSAGSPQVVYLTADPDVAAWARMEAIAGNLAVIEPAGDDEPQDVRTPVDLTA
jgi:hypothetical protein